MTHALGNTDWQSKNDGRSSDKLWLGHFKRQILVHCRASSPGEAEQGSVQVTGCWSSAHMCAWTHYLDKVGPQSSPCKWPEWFMGKLKLEPDSTYGTLPYMDMSVSLLLMLLFTFNFKS